MKSTFDFWTDERGLLIIEGWARRGLTDADIAEKIGITRKTIYEWKKRSKGLCDALKSGKDEADTIVENALYRKAIGYRTTEVAYKADKDGKMTAVSAVEKDVPPDTTAQIFWLKNRRPDLWRDKRKEAESETQRGGVVVLPSLVADAITKIADGKDDKIEDGASKDE